MKLKIAPTTLRVANDFVKQHHRHSKPVVGYKFAVSVIDENGTIRGVAIVGRPVARKLDDGKAAEITRLCTDGAMNACSMLYAAARKAAKALGHDPVITYTLPEEGGASLKAAGFKLDKENAGGNSALWHSREGRTAQAVGSDLFGGKLRWKA